MSFATCSAEIEEVGTHSIQEVFLSIMVKQCCLPSEGVSGPIKSTWRCSILVVGGNCCSGVFVCLVIFVVWHLMHSRAQVVVSLFINGQKYRDVTSFLDVRMPGCDKLWMWSNSCFRSGGGIYCFSPKRYIRSYNFNVHIAFCVDNKVAFLEASYVELAYYLKIVIVVFSKFSSFVVYVKRLEGLGCR